MMPRMAKIGALALLALGLLNQPAAATPEPRAAQELLAAHNRYRTALALPPLRWSAPLAEAAQRWAVHLAGLGRMQHSGSGENLAMGTAGAYSLTQLVDLWGNERRHFVNGTFPAVSSTGNWVDVGHYSQMVWRGTTTLGCGFARGRGQDVLVCHYGPPGNVMGERPY